MLGRLFVVSAWLAAMLGMGTAMALQGQAAPEMRSIVTLGELRDKARPLLIFAPSAQDLRLLDQKGVLAANQRAAAERDLVAVAVPAKGEVTVGKTLAPEEAAEARRRFHVKAGEFAVVLVGKDGGEKLKSAKPLPFKRLADLIDGMPMRQQEMRQKAQ